MSIGKIDFLFIKSLVANIIGRFMAAAFFSLCHLLIRKYRAFRIKKLLGPDAGKKKVFHVFYPGLKPHCVVTAPRGKSKLIKNLLKDDPVRQSEVRAICYLNNLFSLVPGKMEICSDNGDDPIKPYEMSLISLGEWNANSRTVKILKMPHCVGDLYAEAPLESASTICSHSKNENSYTIKIGSDVIRIGSGKNGFVPFPGEKGNDSRFDYGVILRLSGARKEKKVWIVCSGNSSWASSGAAYYLANNWKKLFKKSLGFWKRVLLFPKVKDFAVVIKVKKGHDDTAQLMDFIN